jgi:hypothetical protein
MEAPLGKYCCPHLTGNQNTDVQEMRLVLGGGTRAGLNSGSCACQAFAVPLEPHPSPSLVLSVPSVLSHQTPQDLAAI